MNGKAGLFRRILQKVGNVKRIHWGWQEDEIPEYRRCDCGQLIRIDRLDLLIEHIDAKHGSERDRRTEEKVWN